MNRQQIWVALPRDLIIKLQKTGSHDTLGAELVSVHPLWSKQKNYLALVWRVCTGAALWVWSRLQWSNISRHSLFTPVCLKMWPDTFWKSSTAGMCPESYIFSDSQHRRRVNERPNHSRVNIAADIRKLISCICIHFRGLHPFKRTSNWEPWLIYNCLVFFL